MTKEKLGNVRMLQIKDPSEEAREKVDNALEGLDKKDKSLSDIMSAIKPFQEDV